MKFSLFQIILLFILLFIFFYSRYDFIYTVKKLLTTFAKNIKNQNSLRK